VRGVRRLRLWLRGLRVNPAVARLGLGLAWRPEVANLAIDREDLGFVDVIAENLPTAGALPRGLELLRERGVAIVPHGVGLSLGSAGRVDRSRMRRLRSVAERVVAPLVSEHLAIVRAGRYDTGHLLPVPRTRDSLGVVAENVRCAMGELPVPLALENPASVFEWPDAQMTECQFLAELVEHTGCHLLLDLANLYVNSRNHGFDPVAALDDLPLEHVAYVHVAGGTVRDGVFHDTHADPLWPEVLTLVEHLATRTTIDGVLLERERAIPCRAELAGELDALRTSWARGAAHRRSTRRLTSARERSGSSEERSCTHPTRTVRRGLARDQADLTAALAGRAPDPPGFVAPRLAVARELLEAKAQRQAGASSG
jgi:uncharacterized protein (UPF0276 family)